MQTLFSFNIRINRGRKMHSVIPASFVTQATRRSQNNDQGRNIVAAVFSALLIVLLIMALALPNWYHLKGGGCTRQVLGTEQFFYVGSFKAVTVPAVGNLSYSSLVYYGLNEEMKDCVTPEIVAVQRAIIGLCFVTIFFSFCQFYSDLTGVTHKSLNCTKRCGLGSIFSGIRILI
ncbi:transmembrane protein 127-like [Stegodyphus dumicola]|uniref:transmembrane protein 127-like n=1 Tax=Stegodyphus dumicola TaxID=202533 RepID=UPI0015ABA3AE|nr:transmembrane protein 127-like [Stegodyphus dumicola]